MWLKISVSFIAVTCVCLYCRQPDVACFSTPVKARRVVLKAQRHAAKVNFNMANIYVGKGPSASDIYMGQMFLVNIYFLV